MKYAPAIQLENAVLSEIKKMSTDKQRVQKIVDEANKDTGSSLAGLKKDRKLSRGGLKPASQGRVKPSQC